MPVVSRSILGEISAASTEKARQVVIKTTADIKRGAQARSRVDTGAMKGAFTGQTSGMTGRIEAGAGHTIYNELGTVNMAAQPMLTPAAADAEGPYYAAMRMVFMP
jgi:HK97 gp10 family phage protein